RRRGVPRRPPASLHRPALDEQADDHGEQGDAFDEGGGDDRDTADVAGRFGLAGDRFGGVAGDPPDADAGSDGGDSGPDARAHEAEAPELASAGNGDEGDEKR